MLHTVHLSNILIIVTDADCNNQHAEKVMSDNLELVNFAIWLVNFVLCDGQVMFFFLLVGGGRGGSNHRNTVRQIQNSCRMKAVFQADLTVKLLQVDSGYYIIKE